MYFQQFVLILEDCIRGLKFRVDIEALLPHVRFLIERFINKENVIASSGGFIEDDRIMITERPLVGNKCLLKKVNCHKRTT